MDKCLSFLACVSPNVFTGAVAVLKIEPLMVPHKVGNHRLVALALVLTVARSMIITAMSTPVSTELQSIQLGCLGLVP